MLKLKEPEGAMKFLGVAENKIDKNTFLSWNWLFSKNFKSVYFGIPANSMHIIWINLTLMIAAYFLFFSHATKGTQWTHPRTGKKKVVSGGKK